MRFYEIDTNEQKLTNEGPEWSRYGGVSHTVWALWWWDEIAAGLVLAGLVSVDC